MVIVSLLEVSNIGLNFSSQFLIHMILRCDNFFWRKSDEILQYTDEFTVK